MSTLTVSSSSRPVEAEAIRDSMMSPISAAPYALNGRTRGVRLSAKDSRARMVKSRVLEMATSLIDRVDEDAKGRENSLDKR